MLKNLCDSEGNIIPNYSDRIKELTDVEFVNPEDLTRKEQEVIALLYELDQYLPNNITHEIRIYKKKYENNSVAP